MSLVRIAVRATGDEVEPLRARFLELVPSGFEERAAGTEVELAAYVPDTEADSLLEAFPNASSEAVAEGWEDAWRSFHRPVVVDGLWLGPPWERPPDPGRAVVIDPGRAFGTYSAARSATGGSAVPSGTSAPASYANPRSCPSASK